MKWAFLDRLKTRKNHMDKLDVKKTRNRYKAGLIDFLCTIRTTRSAVTDAASHLSLSSATGVPLCQPSSFVSSLSDLLQYHSLVLRHPIPVSSLSDHPKSACQTSPPAYCPTCRNVVIPLPQKRRSRANDAKPDYNTIQGVKRVRACLDELELAHLRWHLTGKGIETHGHFNPTYEAHQPDTLSSVYSDVYDTTYLENSSAESIADRPKLVGVRRNQSGSSVHHQGILEDWLLRGGTTKQVMDRTYATVYLDEFPSTTIFGHPLVDIPGEPWSSSTLKRRCPRQRDGDDETVYDEVASELDGSSYLSDVRDPCISRTQFAVRRRLSDSPEHLNDHVKRVRREYFVCEE